ncbi:TM1812 family CRISPR-associated protein [Veillonella criceti]|uniref:CRISPR-associated protein, TM1812 family n=1 Tax=Veillonella criceti TaxID=103891 RepID=A0A380NKC6_9FIRM|nr:TM1812 family CRISPR-associated protein [Veillonella criceti]SUP43076.1 CRISPR-associated protein, TM1812 family [Veillonella criceti]
MKHILLSFLSPVRVDKDKMYNPIIFKGIQYERYENTVNNQFTCIQTNEAAVCQLMSDLVMSNNKLDRIFYFSTKKLKENVEFATAKDIIGCDQSISLTGEEFFIKRMTYLYPSLVNRFSGIDYDEDMTGIDGLHSVIQMAQLLKSYADKVNDTVNLYVDMTGGFRNATMMILAVIQLIQHSNIKVSMLLYANYIHGGISRVENITGIHRMMGLISGVNEFINFGSIYDIESYFETANIPISSELANLLAAMKAFSDNVKVCSSNSFETSIKNLKQSVISFSELSDKSVQENLFEQIMYLIQKEYELLFKEDSNRLDIIQWCLDKKFYQQGLTLVTEWMPSIIVDNHICSTEDVEVIKECIKRGQVQKRDWKREFITNYIGSYCTNLQKKKKSAKKEMPVIKKNGSQIRELRYILQQIAKKEPWSSDKLPESLVNNLKCLEKERKSLPDKGKLNEYIGDKKNPHTFMWADRVWRRIVYRDYNYRGSFEHYISRRQVATFFKSLLDFSDEEFLNLIKSYMNCTKSEMVVSTDKVSIDKTTVLDIETLLDSDKEIVEINFDEKRYRKDFSYLFRDVIIQSVVAEEKAIDVLIGYHKIRGIRNNINHANTLHYSYDDIGEELKQYLKLVYGVYQEIKRH